MSNPHLLLTHPYSLTLPHRLTGIPSWHEHIPFAFALVAAIKPRVLVELGTYRGDSFCAFCQVVDGLGLPTACYAVDTWQGDDHAGRYGEEVFEELSRYHDSRYGRFSRLVRSTFDEARSHFADGSVDLLHIDGLHTWEAVAHDFESWRAKLSDRAVVLFHDTNVREREFGVWRLWQELAARHPGFAFVHGHGLGVLAVGAQAPAEILELCALPGEGQAVIRDRFAALGSRVGLMGRLDDTGVRLATSEQGLAQRDQRILGLEKEATALAGELARRDQVASQLEIAAAELKQRLRGAEEGARLLRERVQANDRLLGGVQEELGRLRGLITEGAPGWIARLVGWARKNNRIRLARRKARRGELLYGLDPRLSLPGATTVTGHGLIAWLRRKNRARLAKRKRQVPGTRWDPQSAPLGSPLPAAASRAHHQAGPTPASLADSRGLALPPALVPATAEEAWDAYPRLKGEFVRRRAARHASFELVPPDLVKAPADLEAFARRLAMPTVVVPRVSIIVPVVNQLQDTLECIASVGLHTPSNDYELMVIDDGSTDQSETILPLVKNLRYFRNDASIGLLVSSNRCAAMARGEFLVFLGPRAQVTSGWLPPLLEAFSSHQRVGAAGPRLLDPEGRLREAGAVIDPDLGVTAVGHGDDPRLPRYNQPREVQLCSGTCLVVPRRHFDSVGGFPEALDAAPHADCDLQLKLRKTGLRTIYQPRSVVVLRPGRSGEGPAGSALARSSQWMRERWGDAVDAMHAVRLIAFYLPQFHPFQENEFWWGRGFTEWTNVTKAQPCFAGHEQPHLPTDMGFYDLRVPEVMHEQARMARAYGISGFCYYYYWFHGKRLLETPIERLLDQPAAALPFCLCWANENWTRRWDGGDGESEVLMGQAHSEEDDEAVILDLLRFLRHPSYIRVGGKPMLLVYRVGLFPDIGRTAALWRDVCRREGLGEIHLVRADTFEDARRCTPPRDQGFDAAVEFPPHAAHAPLAQPPQPLRPGFSGIVYDYESQALHAATSGEAGYLRYRTVIPRWDNTPRRQDAATIFAGSSPGAYQAYLEEVLRTTREQNVGDERIVFVNAWNEWAEGAHLEADRRYGRTYLEATLAAAEEHLLAKGADSP
jgi:GT2 family glycosyltransferase